MNDFYLEKFTSKKDEEMRTELLKAFLFEPFKRSDYNTINEIRDAFVITSVDANKAYSVFFNTLGRMYYSKLMDGNRERED